MKPENPTIKNLFLTRKSIESFNKNIIENDQMKQIKGGIGEWVLINGKLVWIIT